MKINKIVLFSIVAFIFGICSANAEQLFCEYGVRKNEDDPSTFEKKVTIIYNLDKETRIIDFTNSPLFGDDRNKFEFDSETNLYTYSFSVYGEVKETIYLTNHTPYKECPKSLEYEKYHESKESVNKTNSYTYYLLFNSDIDKSAFEKEFDEYLDWFSSSRMDKQDSLIMYSKEVNDDVTTTPGAVLDENKCITYSDQMRKIKDTLTEENKCESNPKFSSEYAELQNLCSSYMSTSYYSDKDGRARECSTACSMLYDDIAELCKDSSNRSYCGSLGNRMVNWLFKILNFIRYGLPPVAIILSILDYMRAIAADNEDEIKKVNGKIVKRLIAVALIFIFPFILNFILGIFDIPGLNASNPFCAK